MSTLSWSIWPIRTFSSFLTPRYALLLGPLYWADCLLNCAPTCRLPLDLRGLQCHQRPWGHCSGARWERGHHCRGILESLVKAAITSHPQAAFSSANHSFLMGFSGAEAYSWAGDHWSWGSCAQPPRGGKSKEMHSSDVRRWALYSPVILKIQTFLKLCFGWICFCLLKISVNSWIYRMKWRLKNWIRKLNSKCQK